MVWIIWLVISLSMFASVDWLAHISMTKDHSSKRGWGNYKKFKREFEKIEWKPLLLYSKSFANRDNDSEIHANIIKFNGVGMIINNPISLYLCKRYVKKQMLSKPKVELHKW
jgi:hypothetical protein